MWRAAGIFVVAALCALAGSSALGARAQAPAVYDVTLRGTVTKTWRYDGVEFDEEDCERRTTLQGRRTVTFRSVRPARVSVAAGRSGRVRYIGRRRLLVRAVVASSGERSARLGGPEACPQGSAGRVRCPRRIRRISASVTFTARRQNQLRVSRLRYPRDVGCEPPPVRAEEIGTDVPTGKLRERVLLDETLAELAVPGEAVDTTTFEGDDTGRVVQRVRWTLVFERAGGGRP